MNSKLNNHKKILFVGLTSSIHHALPAIFLAQNGFKITLVCEKNDIDDIEKLIGSGPLLDKIVIGSKNNKLRDELNYILKIWQMRNNFDLLYLYSPHIVFRLLLSRVRYRKPIVYHTQDFLDPTKYRLRPFLEGNLMRRADLVVVNDPNRAMFFKTFYGLKENPLVVRTSLPSNFPFSSYNSDKREKWLKKAGIELNPIKVRFGLHIGSYSQKRCTDSLLASLKLLPENFILIFTGNTPDTKAYSILNEKIRNMELEKRVGILPRLSIIELLELTAQADVGFLLYPDDDLGNYYQCPGRLTEYVGSGVPVVASQFPSLEIAIRRYNIGTVCDPFNPEDIARAFYNLSSESSIEKREKLKRIFKDFLAYEIDGIKLVDAIKKLLR